MTINLVNPQSIYLVPDGTKTHPIIQLLLGLILDSHFIVDITKYRLEILILPFMYRPDQNSLYAYYYSQTSISTPLERAYRSGISQLKFSLVILVKKATN